jgi:4a-hydroxytetrahydrobiopterin dehydratase
MAELIKADELKNRLKKIPEWELEKKHIERTFEFDEFSEAIDFVNSVAEVAEDEEHHPDIDIRYNKVRLILSTHSKGGLTDLDFGLAGHHAFQRHALDRAAHRQGVRRTVDHQQRLAVADAARHRHRLRRNAER